MLYKSGLEASWNPGMSEPSRSVKKALHVNPSEAYNPSDTNQPGSSVGAVSIRGKMSGLYGVRGLSGIDGLSFAYRLQEWGPKVGPPLLPADAFSSSYTPNNLGSPFTWIKSIVGLDSAQDILAEAKEALEEASDTLAPLSTKIQTLVNTVSEYVKSTDSMIQNKAQATLAQGAGLVAGLSTLQRTLASLHANIQNASYDSGTPKDVAENLLQGAEAFGDQVDDFSDSVNTFASSTKSLQKAAFAGPSNIQNALISSVTGSVSTLTWIIGGSVAAYVLAPTLIPRVIGGVKKGIRS